MNGRSPAGSQPIDVAEYYRTYGPMVLRRCRSLLRDEEMALDAMQDTFVKLIRNRSRLTHKAPSSLLYRIATNVCLNRIRSSKRHPEDQDDALLQRIACVQEPGIILSTRDMLSRLFGQQRPSTRTIAVLHLLDGLTLEEVASQVGLSVSGVRKRLRKLRQKLHELESAQHQPSKGRGV